MPLRLHREYEERLLVAGDIRESRTRPQGLSDSHGSNFPNSTPLRFVKVGIGPTN